MEKVINEFEKGILTYLGSEKYFFLKEIKIAVLGAGGLGSNCAFNLVRCGFTKFVLIDFDIVEPSNLNRQFYFLNQCGKPKVEALKENLLKINPDLEIETFCQKIESKNDLKTFDDCDAIIEAFDNSFYKKITAEYFMKRRNLLVSASGISGFGNSDRIKVKKISETFYIVGDFVSESNEKTPPFSPCVNIAAAKQADIVFEFFYKCSV
ncbi:MAG: sulfur carrier protein ThiS adenylyltransferase ThiF [Desulforegulaceae bacterium]|nr:sulfur carrier protein ThiS adenylyltransferase ThiF [Desulforegulaceae bacterium]